MGVKKLLFVITEFATGGAEIGLLNLFNILDSSMYEIDFIILRHESTDRANIDKLPPWINVCDALKKNKEFLSKLKRKLKINSRDILNGGQAAIDFVQKKSYDIAISYGEWFLPEFVAKRVSAKKKVVWIHSDLDKAKYVDINAFVQMSIYIDCLFFVSEHSMKSAINKYPFLLKKAFVVHNVINEKKIMKLASEPLKLDVDKSKKVIVNVANVRDEKNHMRAAMVYSKIKAANIKAVWVNVGAISNEGYYDEIIKYCVREGIQDDFIFVGMQENPYKYMKAADVIVNTSDYESWSIVITEAKVLRKLVVATKTSGALEQIEHEATGILADFHVNDFAEKLIDVLANEKLNKKIVKNLEGIYKKNNSKIEFNDVIKQIESIQSADKNDKSILFTIDNVNYRSGAHKAIFSQMKYLKLSGYNVSVLSPYMPEPDILEDLEDINLIYSWSAIKSNEIFTTPFLYIMMSRYYSKQAKLLKLKMSYVSRRFGSAASFNRYVASENNLAEIINNYDIVCVPFENSLFRQIVSSESCKCLKKIQWVHTDYESWSELNDYTRTVTSNDRQIYSNFDKIVFVSNASRDGFVKRYPDFEYKTDVNANFLDCNKIKSHAGKKVVLNKRKLKFVTVGRIELEKNIKRLIEIAYELDHEGYDFQWTLIGSGSLRDECVAYSISLGLSEKIKWISYTNDPFSFINDADVFALFSEYEGLPNTIFESLIIGTPVIATRVGGIPEQIEHGKNGWLVENEKESIKNGLKFLFEHDEEIFRAKEYLKNYNYDNEKIKKKNDEIFSL